MLTTQEKINIGYVCSILASNEISGGNKQGGQIDLRLPKLLHHVTFGLEQLYQLDPTNEDIEPIGNMLIGMCRYELKAESKLDISQSGVTTDIFEDIPDALDFIVSASSIIPTGAISPNPDGTFPQFIGFDVNFYRNGSVQYTTDPGDGSNFYSWDKDTGRFEISTAANAGEQFRITV